MGNLKLLLVFLFFVHVLLKLVLIAPDNIPFEIDTKIRKLNFI